MDYADASGSPYTTSQVITNAYALVFITGMLLEACRNWRRRPAFEKTWNNFKLDVSEAHQDLQQIQATSQGSGYHGANSAQDSFATETADAFANLATATASDHQMLAELSATSTTLPTQLATKDAELSQLQNSRPARSTGQLQNRSTNPSNHSANPTCLPPNLNYCWTQGYQVGCQHDSSNCMQRNEGHKAEATRADTMGVVPSEKETDR
jgi:hypothetical protein